MFSFGQISSLKKSQKTKNKTKQTKNIGPLKKKKKKKKKKKPPSREQSEDHSLCNHR